MKKIICLMLILLCPILAHAALSKAVTSVDTWTAVAANTTAEGATATLTSNYQTILVIDAALTSTTATTNGLGLTVQGSTATSGDNNWFNLTVIDTLAGTTGVTRNITDNPLAAGSTIISIANTTGFTTKASGVYVKDVVDITQSEVTYLSNYTSNSNITVYDATTNQHNNTASVYNSLASIPINIPDTVVRIRVIYNNARDAAGSAVDVRSYTEQITGI